MPRAPGPRASLRVARIGLALLLAAALPGAAGGVEADEIDRWVPAFGPYFGVIGQKARGAVTDVGDVIGSPLPEGGCLIERPNQPPMRNGTLCDQIGGALGGPPLQIVPESSSSDTQVAPLVGGTFELMTPRLTDALLSPRLFAHADFAFSFSFERNLAGNGAPGAFRLPVGRVSNQPLEIGIQGQGTRVKSELQPLLFSAGAGLAFTHELFDRALRFKPSFEYLWQEQKLIGIAHRAVKLKEDPDFDDLPTDFRFIVLNRNQTESQHGLGAGIEVEADSGRIGPFVLSLFLWGRGYRILGETEHRFTVDNPDVPGESVTYEFDFSPWVWRSGIGLRFRFLPE